MVVVEFMNEALRNKGTKQDHWGHDQKQRKEYGPRIWTKYKPASEAESLQQVFIFEELRSGEIKLMSYDNVKFNRENKSWAAHIASFPKLINTQGRGTIWVTDDTPVGVGELRREWICIHVFLHQSHYPPQQESSDLLVSPAHFNVEHVRTHPICIHKFA